MSTYRAPGVIAQSATMVSLSSIAGFLRIWSNVLRKDRQFGYDDFFAIAALPFIWAENAVMFWWISLGFGRHVVDVPPQDLAQAPKILLIISLLYEGCIGLPKFSAIFFYYRIFGKTSLWFYRSLWVIGFLHAALLIAACLSTIFQCDPVEKIWDFTVPGHCLPQWNYFLGIAIFSTALDLIILLIPLPQIWRLHTTRLRKLLITGVFVAGYSVVVVSIGRTVALVQVQVLGRYHRDITWCSVPYVEWVQCEGPISLISVCLPNIYHLVRRAHKYGLISIFTGRIPSPNPDQNRVELRRASSILDSKWMEVTEVEEPTTIFQNSAHSARQASAEGGWTRQTATAMHLPGGAQYSHRSRDDQIYVTAEVDVFLVDAELGAPVLHQARYGDPPSH